MNLVESGELTEEDAKDTFSGMESELNEKLNDYNSVLRSLGLDLELIDSEMARLSKLKSEKQNQINGVKARIINGLTNINKNKFDTGLFKGHIRKGVASVKVVNPEKIPAEFVETEVLEKANKTAIKKAMQDGQEIAGCELTIGKPSLITK